MKTYRLLSDTHVRYGHWKQLIDVAHVSMRGTSVRITLPKKIVQRLKIGDGEIIAFYEDNGIKIDKLK